MLHFLPSPLIGTIALLLLVTNTVFWVGCFVPIVIARTIVPSARFRQGCSGMLIALAWCWIDGNGWIVRTTQRLVWDVELPPGLDANRSYLVVCNHRSWTDIHVLQHVFKRRIPFLKFFLKKELIWVPFLGFAWWALEFPFMQRRSLEHDMDTLRRSCEAFKRAPVSVLNFLEGTRFTPDKRLAQRSPYANLLKPRAGGTAFVLSAMGDRLSGVLDVTVVYPGNPPRASIWQFLKGEIGRVVVRARLLPLPADTVGRDYLKDREYTARMRDWVNGIWHEKERLIHDLRDARLA
jgi:1-acyl-sn-glycerol-3-phosphate acyltransferase